jgi:cobalt/nickel transport system permease protein/cobalt/nickel transport protein
MDRIVEHLSIGLIFFIILVLLSLLATGITYGEWAPNGLRDKIEFVPHILEELSDLWHAPLHDYIILNRPFFQDSKLIFLAGYILSALIGVIIGGILLCGSLLYFIGKKDTKN